MGEDQEQLSSLVCAEQEAADACNMVNLSPEHSTEKGRNPHHRSDHWQGSTGYRASSRREGTSPGHEDLGQGQGQHDASQLMQTNAFFQV